MQFFSDSDRYPLRGKDECTLKKNYARTNTLSLVFSIGSWTCGTLYHCLFLGQQLMLVLRKEWGSFKLEMCEVFIIIILLIFFVHISICIFTFLIFCLIKCQFLWYEYFLEGGLSCMGSLTLLQTVLMTMPLYFSLSWNLLPLNCNKRIKVFSGIKCSLPGAPNDGFLLNTLKTLFRLSRVLLDL